MTRRFSRVALLSVVVFLGTIPSLAEGKRVALVIGIILILSANGTRIRLPREFRAAQVSGITAGNPRTRVVIGVLEP
jgi:hypothetical protein